MANKRNSKEKGITLVALVITIIILLILAGVTIMQLTGNGLLQKVEQAKEKSEEKSAEETLNIELANLLIDKKTNPEYNKDEYLTAKLTEKGFIVNENIVDVYGYKFQINRDVPEIVLSLGKETENKYITISNAEGLKKFIDEVNAGETYAGKTVTLTGNIDFSSICSESLGSFTPIGNSTSAFEGIFDGQNYTISNLYINSQDSDNIALFGVIKNGGVRNLTVTGSVTGNGNNVAGVIGYIENGYVENCINNVNVENTATECYRAGGVVALMKNSSIKECENYGTIKANYQQSGGIVATVIEDSEEVKIIENCENYGNVTATNISGGIVGYVNAKYLIKNCYNKQDTKITASTQYASGGILGYCGTDGVVTIENCTNDGNCEAYISGAGGIAGGNGGSLTITNCNNNGQMYASTSCAGGILGYADNNSKLTNITNCNNSGYIKVESWAGGGIIGNLSRDATIEYCQNTGEVYGINGNCGGIVGSIGENDTTISTLTINSSFNKGYIHGDGKNGNPALGGIIGTTQFGDSAIINNCYNTGEIASTSYTSGNIYHGVGGIVGTIYNNATATSTKSKATVTNCYNTGNTSNSYSSIYAGQIIGRDHNNNRTVTNCYYLSTATGTNTCGGTSVIAANLKKYASTLGNEYKDDKELPLNSGYPILIWQ